MHKNIISLIVLLNCLLSTTHAQQLPFKNLFSETNFVTNPGMTGFWNYLEFGATYQQQWSEFNQAPKNMMAYIQAPLIEQKMSLGGSVMHDQVGLLEQNAVSLNYAFKLHLGIKRRDQLAIGIGANFFQVSLNNSEYLGLQADDPNLVGQTSSVFKPNFSAGIFYASDSRSSDNNFLFGGVGLYSAIPQQLGLVNEAGDIQKFDRVIQANGIVGMRFTDGVNFVEPNLSVDFSQPNILHLLASVRFDFNEQFWGGVGYATSNMMYLNLGTTISGSFLQDGSLRVGSTISANTSQLINQFGIGYEFYLSYRFFFDNPIF